MSKRKFYRNFNKRKKFNGTRVVTVVLCLAIIGTYTYINLKDKNFMDKLGNINMVSSIRKASIWGGLKNIFDKSNVITSSNIESQLKEIENDNKDKKDEEESTKVVSVNEMVIYTIQVASLENESELKKIEEVMNENKIPSVISKDINDSSHHISKYLKTLKEYGLVVCLNENDKRYRYYSITPKGTKYLNIVKNKK